LKSKDTQFAAVKLPKCNENSNTNSSTVPNLSKDCSGQFQIAFIKKERKKERKNKQNITLQPGTCEKRNAAPCPLCFFCLPNSDFFAGLVFWFWFVMPPHSLQLNLIERNTPPRGGFLFTMFPRQELCVRGPVQICTRFFEGGPITHGS